MLTLVMLQLKKINKQWIECKNCKDKKIKLSCTNIQDLPSVNLTKACFDISIGFSCGLTCHRPTH